MRVSSSFCPSGLSHARLQFAGTVQRIPVSLPAPLLASRQRRSLSHAATPCAAGSSRVPVSENYNSKMFSTFRLSVRKNSSIYLFSFSHALDARREAFEPQALYRRLSAAAGDEVGHDLAHR